MKKNALSIFSRLFALAGLLIVLQPNAHAQDQAGTMQPPTSGEAVDAGGAAPASVAAAPDIASVLESEGDFTTLLAALQDTGLIAELQDSTQQFTVFAPTDDAFASLPEGTLSEMDADQLRDVLSYHIVPSDVSLSDAAAEGTATTEQGADLTIEGDAGGSATVDGATISEADIEASNGTIHVIDAVLLPAQEGAAMQQEQAAPQPEEPAMPPQDAPEENAPPQPEDPQNAPQPNEPPQR